jgi:HAD superfamily hydrolase (TIGR01484 family)
MRPLTTYKHLFFDLDDTLTLTKTPIEDEHKLLLEGSGKDIIVVSGADKKRIAFQTKNLRAFYLGQNGNDATKDDGKRLWQDFLTQAEKSDILRHISELATLMSWRVKDEHDLIEDRGCQISFSIVGHHEDVIYKKSFDPHSHVRMNMLSRYPFENTITEVKVGGTTTFDYFKKGAHKGSNVLRLIETMGWNKDECVYFGDKLHPGGNDETVIGVIDTVAVKDHHETFSHLRDAFAK